MDIKSNFKKTKYYLKRYGILNTIKKILKRILRIRENKKSNQEQYEIWRNKNKYDLEKQKNTEFSYSPKISIVVPMYKTNMKFFEELINSLKNQTYSKWELCLADGSPEKNKEFEKIIENNNKIKYKFLGKNEGISENTNEAIKMATGEYIGFLDHDDTLSENALYEIVNCLNKDKSVDFIYTDEDKLDQNYMYFDPYFKPDFSPETLECNNYITHFVVVKKDLIDKIGMLDSKYNGAQDFDFVLRATEKSKKIVHIPKVLYHWRVHRESTAFLPDTKPYAFEAGKRAVEAHLNRIGKKANVEESQDVPGAYKINYEIVGNPNVTIIIPNKDNIKLLKRCINSILKLTTYKNYEIFIIENNSIKNTTFKYYKKIAKNTKIKILNYNKNTIMDLNGERKLELDNNENSKLEFNYSSLINFGVKNSKSDFILQLNNDTLLLTPNWLEIFIGYAQNKEIGAVGARLYYPDKTIQHAGIILGINGIAGNALVNLPYGKHAYFGIEAITRNISAVTGACLFCRRNLYEEVGFMDNKKFKVAFNDVDFCLKLLERGYRNIYNPYIELIHYESKTRGYEDSPEKIKRFEKETENFRKRWSKLLQNDPYYNPNLSRKTVNYDIKTEE